MNLIIKGTLLWKLEFNANSRVNLLTDPIISYNFYYHGKTDLFLQKGSVRFV
jgi:hypothetical protein